MTEQHPNTSLGKDWQPQAGMKGGPGRTGVSPGAGQGGPVKLGSVPRASTYLSVSSRTSALTSRNLYPQSLNFSFLLKSMVLIQVASVTTLTLRAEIVTEWHDSLSPPQHQRQCPYLGHVGLFNVIIWRSGV